jgi:hypothetical protein
MVVICLGMEDSCAAEGIDFGECERLPAEMAPSWGWNRSVARR